MLAPQEKQKFKKGHSLAKKEPGDTGGGADIPSLLPYLVPLMQFICALQDFHGNETHTQKSSLRK